MIRISIVEDDSSAVSELKSFLKRFEQENKEEFQIAVYKNGMEFVELYSPTTDIIFMDIKMPFLNGMDAAKKIREIDPHVCLIFVTNMIEFAVKGYEVDALYYLVKPIEYFDFSIKLKKAIGKIQKNSADELMLNFKDGFKRIKIEEIRYIEVSGHNLIFHTENADHIIRGTLKKMEEGLKYRHFSRCNHYALVNLKYVNSLNQNIITVGKAEIQISRAKRKTFLDDLTRHLGGIK